MKVKELPITDRPREKAIKYGFKALSDKELLALLIRTGNKTNSAIDIAQQLLNKYGSIRNCLQLNLEELCKQSGIKKAKALVIMSSIELARRMTLEDIKQSDSITNPKVLTNWFNYQFTNLMQEIFVVVYLNIKNNVIGFDVISKGGLNSASIHAREVFRNAIVKGAANIICIHNHPSNDITPSSSDNEVTIMLSDASKLVDIPLLDHVIVGSNKYYSFRENNLISE